MTGNSLQVRHNAPVNQPSRPSRGRDFAALAGFVALCLAIGAAMHALVVEEERFLSARFGAAWEAYRRRVPRYLGWRR